TVGMIGAGKIGQLHANNILRSDSLHLKAISDIKIDQLKETDFYEQVSVITSDPEELFTDPEIQAVFICSLTDTHADFIKAAAKAGKHVFCEKPISYNIEETKKVMQVVKQARVKFQVGFNRRFDKH